MFIIGIIGVLTALIALAAEYFYYKDKVPIDGSGSGISTKMRRKEAEIQANNQDIFNS